VKANIVACSWVSAMRFKMLITYHFRHSVNLLVNEEQVGAPALGAMIIGCF